MDILRAPYTVKARFFKDRPDILVDQIWYPCADDAADIKYPNFTGSVNWENQMFPDESPIGGVRRQTERDYNGRQVIPTALGLHQCGTAEEWSDGCVYDPLAPPAPRNDAGLPLCCGPVMVAHGGGMGGGGSQPIVPHGGGMCGGFAPLVPFGPCTLVRSGTTCLTAIPVTPAPCFQMAINAVFNSWNVSPGTSGHLTDVTAYGISSQSVEIYTGASCAALTLRGTLTAANPTVSFTPTAGDNIYYHGLPGTPIGPVVLLVTVH